MSVIAVLIGFGRTDPYGGADTYAKELQEVQLPLLSTDTCQRIVNQDADSPTVVTDNMLCAGSVGGWKGGCFGDSGELHSVKTNCSVQSAGYAL